MEYKSGDIVQVKNDCISMYYVVKVHNTSILMYYVSEDTSSGYLIAVDFDDVNMLTSILRDDEV